MRECQEHNRTTEEDKAKENGKIERSTKKVKVSADLPLGVVREPAGLTCEKEEKKPGRQRKKVDRDEKDSFFI